MAHMETFTRAFAREIIGGLSEPGKMPCKGYSVHPCACGVGSILRTVPGSTCFYCYGCKGFYLYPSAQEALYRRLLLTYQALTNVEYRSLYVRAFALLLSKEAWFRWFDNGDLQSVAHLRLIADIAKLCPDTTFWLPTREYDAVRLYLGNHTLPDNLTVRLSAHRIDHGADNANKQGLDLPTSGVQWHKPAPGFQCPAPKQGGKCADCRACFSRRFQHITYAKH